MANIRLFIRATHGRMATPNTKSR